MQRRRREKTFGPGRSVPVDRNAKARIEAYARAWNARHKTDRQHKGPITRAFLDVLAALLWKIQNRETGVCFPSYEYIAEKAECARSTVAEALKVLEWAGVLTWQHRLTRVREACTDLFGRATWRWRVVRSSNAYVFRDPSKSENRPGTQKDTSYPSVPRAPIDPNSPLERALASFGRTIEGKNAPEQADITRQCA